MPTIHQVFRNDKLKGRATNPGHIEYTDLVTGRGAILQLAVKHESGGTNTIELYRESAAGLLKALHEVFPGLDEADVKSNDA